MMDKLYGFMGKALRVDLTNERITSEELDQTTLKQFIGGSGLGTKIMYDEVPAGVEWDDPQNRMIWAAGVLNGTGSPGCGTYAVVTKGVLTRFLTATHANGFFGARLKFAGYDAIIVQGSAKKWVYLNINDGVAELHDAAHLLGKDTYETEDTIKKEIAKPLASISCIGPAGENLVKYACISSDRGHICSTNGCGAVMGSKKLKAIAVQGRAAVPIYDKSRFSSCVKEWWEHADSSTFGQMLHSIGTGYVTVAETTGMLPMKNLTTVAIEDHYAYQDFYNRDNWKLKSRPCYACKLAHCHDMEVSVGPHKGEWVEEPEFESLACFSSQIGNSTDPNATIWLAGVNDRLGMCVKEQAWVLGLAFECYEKGLITKKDTDGLELTWGNVEAVEALLHNIATRKGFGNVLAEGVMRAAQKIGGDAPNFAVHTHKGNGPHVHDCRSVWHLMFSQSVSDMGSALLGFGDVGELTEDTGLYVNDPSQAFTEQVAKNLAITSRKGNFIDSVGACVFVSEVPLKTIAETISAVTGWNFTWRDAADIGERTTNLMRMFALRHGHKREDDIVSPKLKLPLQDGQNKGVSIGPKFDKLVDAYYQSMGWDKEGRPLPETLKKLGLEFTLKDLK